METTKRTAVIVLAKCPKHHKTYGIRTEKLGHNHWLMTWAFPIKEKTAKNEGFDKTHIEGNIEQSPEYPGCPYCGNKLWGLCLCGHLLCATGMHFHCDWCGIDGDWGGIYNGERIDAGKDA